MPLELTCPSCGQQLRIAEEHAGKAARCPKCSTIFTAPSEAAGSRPATSEFPQQASKFTEPSQPRWSMRTPAGTEYGPVPKYELDAWVNEGRVTPHSQLRPEGTDHWRAAVEIYPQLGSSSPFAPQKSFGNPARSGSAGAVAVSNPYSPPASPVGYGNVSSPYRQMHRGPMVLIFGISGWLVSCLCIAGIIFSILAWVFGAQDLRAMREGRMEDSGRGLTQAGMILGMIHCILAGVGMIAYIGFIIFAVANDL